MGRQPALTALSRPPDALVDANSALQLDPSLAQAHARHGYGHQPPNGTTDPPYLSPPFPPARPFTTWVTMRARTRRWPVPSPWAVRVWLCLGAPWVAPAANQLPGGLCRTCVLLDTSPVTADLLTQAAALSTPGAAPAPASAHAAHQSPAPVAMATAAAAPAVVKHDWYQSDVAVTVEILLKNLPADAVATTVTDQALSATVQLPGGGVYV